MIEMFCKNKQVAGSVVLIRHPEGRLQIKDPTVRVFSVGSVYTTVASGGKK